MTRALSLTCLAILAFGMLGSRAFAGKPSIAVLGLEVVDQNGTPTPADTQAAKELSDGLRSRAKVSIRYQLAPASDKELIDQKLLNNCDSEAPACMSAIGTQLSADVLMYGHFEKQGKAYQVTIKVLDVGRKTAIKSSTDMIPLGEASGAALQGWAKKIYAKLTDESAGATLIVKVSNADRGTILVNGEEKGTFTSGTGTVSGVAEGKVKVAIESEGFKRWEKEVTVSGGTATVQADLEKGAGGTPIGPTGPGDGGGSGIGPGGGPVGPVDHGGGGNGVWKATLAGGVAIGLAGGGWWIYNYKKLSDVRDEQCSHGIVNNGCTPTGSSAGYDKAASDSKGDKASTQTYVGFGIAAAGALVAGFSLYKLMSHSDSGAEHASARGRRVRKDRTFIVTPVVAPSGGGATLRLDW